MSTITLRISDEANAALDAWAMATDRSKSYLALRAIDEFLKLNFWQIEAIHAGIADADAGRMIEHGDVKQRWEHKLTDSIWNSGVMRPNRQLLPARIFDGPDSRETTPAAVGTPHRASGSGTLRLWTPPAFRRTPRSPRPSDWPRPRPKQ